jgi:hypothetical protein
VLACLVLLLLPLPRQSALRRRALATSELTLAFGPDGRDPTADRTADPAGRADPIAGPIAGPAEATGRPPTAEIAVSSAVVLVVAVLVAGPAWGLLCAAVTAGGIWLGRRWIPAAAAAALAGACGLYVIVHEQRGKFGAGFGWVGEFDTVQRPALAAVVLLVSNVVVAEWARRGQPRWAEEDRPDP